MYAPRMSAGASAATTACEVGTQSISPITKMTITNAITGADPFAFSSRNGTPIIGIASPSFKDAGTWATRRVRRSWNTVTNSGFRIIKQPHTAGDRWCVVVTEIGRSTAVAIWGIVAKTDASRKSRNGESRRITANESRWGGPFGA